MGEIEARKNVLFGRLSSGIQVMYSTSNELIMLLP